MEGGGRPAETGGGGRLEFPDIGGGGRDDVSKAGGGGRAEVFVSAAGVSMMEALGFAEVPLRDMLGGGPPHLATSASMIAAISFCPPAVANAEGDILLAFNAQGSAPFRNRLSTSSWDPCSVATCNGVFPLMPFFELTSMPMRKSGSNAAGKTKVHASCNKPLPFSFVLEKSAPAFNSFSKMSNVFFRTASTRGVQSWLSTGSRAG